MRSVFEPIQCVLVVLLFHAGSIIANGDEPNELKRTLGVHESQLATLSNAKIAWTVRYLDANGTEQSVEKFSTVLSQSGEVTTNFRGNAKPVCAIWNSNRFVDIVGYDANAELKSDIAVVGMRASLYDDVKPIRRLFPWRSLRSYRLFASDPDMTFVDLCNKSSFDPKVLLDDGDIFQVKIGHPGSTPDPNIGTPGIPRGTSVLISFDKTHGHLVNSHETTLMLAGETQPFTQIMRVLKWDELAAGEYFPAEVQYVAKTGGNVVFSQLIQFDLSEIGELSGQDSFRLPPNLLVTSFGKPRSTMPHGYHVTTKHGDLGPEYADLRIALVRQSHQLGRVNDAEFKAQLKAIGESPEVGAKAPTIVARNMRSNESDMVSFDKQFTAIEFWSTTCGPCQYSMSAFNEFASEVDEKYPGKVQCIAICLDEDASVAKNHIDARKWFNLTSFLDRYVDESRKTSPSYPFEIARKYVVTGVPLCVLIDQNGTIVFRGHSFDEGKAVLMEYIDAK
ncbi:TlpA disulfide reductase family protein [Novipirellula caenicola]|uniref:Thioredoxin domain-containing protein n=1 Tax=Novipirellula caenicola TaxID=1536901 RepID=A0ABP9VJM4_9BACT